MNNRRKSSAQSLFQVFYLGYTPVDRRCSSSVMPWVIEELKLKAEQRRLIWLSPGEAGWGGVMGSRDKGGQMEQGHIAMEQGHIAVKSRVW